MFIVIRINHLLSYPLTPCFIVFQNGLEDEVMKIYVRNLVTVLAEHWLADPYINPVEDTKDILQATTG